MVMIGLSELFKRRGNGKYLFCEIMQSSVYLVLFPSPPSTMLLGAMSCHRAIAVSLPSSDSCAREDALHMPPGLRQQPGLAVNNRSTAPVPGSSSPALVVDMCLHARVLSTPLESQPVRLNISPTV